MEYLEVNDVVKRYANHLALDHVSLQIRKGSVFGLLGPNGAGKSTLIRIINRITMADEGVITLDGKEITNKDVYRIGYLPEERGLYRKMKVGEQAIYLARLRGMHQSDAKKALTEWFEKFDIMGWWNRKVEELSKGMQQKVQFICTVIHRPELLIFDEPFSGFDPVNAELLKKEILELRDAGCTVIFSTHNMSSVEEICDDIALIDHSKVRLSGNVQEVRDRFFTGIISFRLRSTDPISEDIFAPYRCVERKVVSDEVTHIRIEAPNVPLKELISTLPDSVRLLELKEERPSMKEIFIQVVNPSKQQPII